MTKEQAKALYKSRFWEPMTARERAEFQLYEDHLCMPWDVFHAAIEEVLGRGVQTIEFGLARDALKAELTGDRAPPTLDDILALIPVDKRVILLETSS